MIASISTTMLNNIGDNGSPCLKAFYVWKYLSMSSLTLMAKLSPKIKLLIRMHHSVEKLFIRSVYWTKDNLTLS
jgi:hypothetical protein